MHTQITVTSANRTPNNSEQHTHNTNPSNPSDHPVQHLSNRGNQSLSRLRCDCGILGMRGVRCAAVGLRLWPGWAAAPRWCWC